ncbi:hypothetical protein [Paraburkholderia sediminicola]|uniref:hypothetical protein n=1 Tax=Paraburkholderia sediminicola TaxID=458836 RepID=UPI0038B7882A
MADTQNTYSGSYSTQNKHPLTGGLLDAAIADWEAIATKFGTDAIKDSSTRARYMAHIKEISNQVRQEVDSGNMTVQDGAVYCNQLRDKLFIEYRKYTSAVGVAQAEQLKLSSRGFDYYLNKYAQKEFQKNFTDLTEQERGKIYYEVIKSAGRGNDSVNAKIKTLRVRGSVFLLVTAILATGEVIGAKDKVKELARQGSIIAGGMIGGGLAGFGVSFVCGPAEPLCAVALVYIGSNVGGIAGEVANDAYQDELDEFMRWMKK